MVWTTKHDVALCREILVVEPYKYKVGSREKGQSWDRIATALNSLVEPRFSVDQRAVRERFSKLEKYIKKKTASEERASGISPETSELDEAMENILELIETANIEQGAEKESRKKREEQEKETAASVRKRSMERLSETTERECQESKKKRGIVMVGQLNI